MSGRRSKIQFINRRNTDTSEKATKTLLNEAEGQLSVDSGQNEEISEAETVMNEIPPIAPYRQFQLKEIALPNAISLTEVGEN